MLSWLDAFMQRNLVPIVVYGFLVTVILVCGYLIVTLK